MKIKNPSNRKNILKLSSLISILVLILFFTGCNLTARSSDVYANYHVGTSGLTLDFISQAPPPVLYEEESFEIHASLKNEGAFNINNKSAAKITLLFDNYPFLGMNVNTNNLFQQIEGKSVERPTGGYDDFIIATDAVANLVKGNFETTSTNIYLAMCYPYETLFIKQVCIDTDINGRSLRKQICHAEELSYSDGQGAPVAVTKIIPKMIPVNNYVDPQFTITISNVGEGKVMQPLYETGGEFTYTCSNEAKQNIVEISAKLRGENLVCFPNNITLKGGEGTTTCRFEKDEILMTNSNFYTTLEVNLKYNYEQIYSTKMQIKRKSDLIFADTEYDDIRCQSWETEDDGKCVDLCEYCANNDANSDYDGSKCYVALSEDKEVDSTVIGSNMACVYSLDNCIKANKYVVNKNVDNKCITREGLCWPGMYCGVPMCTTDKQYNYAPKINIKELTSTSPDKITWRVTDVNDQLNDEGIALFGSKNMYPDAKRTCGTKTENNIPVSYYYFVNKLDACPEYNDNDNKYKLATSIYEEEEIFPAVFETDIDTNNEGLHYEYVCLRAVDKLGLETIQKYEIITNSKDTSVFNTKLE